jgi:hypothetical protein
MMEPDLGAASSQWLAETGAHRELCMKELSIFMLVARRLRIGQ